jgi:sulfide:quinone oxidoreductase
MRVVIAGGGVAALEAALALRELAPEGVDLEIVAPEPQYWHRPLAVAEPFGLGTVQRLDLGRMAAHVDAAFTIGELARVDGDRHCAWTTGGAAFEYDVLVVACGARPEPAVPGALTFRGAADTDRLRELLDTVRSVAYVVPEGVAWPLPAYELALLTAAHRPGVKVVLSTPEEEPLAAFGAAVSDAVRALLDERGIEFRPQALEVDHVVALPRLRGPAVAGLPHDENGFIPVDAYGRVPAMDDVYAVGDATDFPVKLGSVAAQQADAVAETIASGVLRPFDRVLRGMLLSAAPLWWPPTKVAARRLGPFLEGRETPDGPGFAVELRIPPAAAGVVT